jgi:hypothetical protein
VEDAPESFMRWRIVYRGALALEHARALFSLCKEQNLDPAPAYSLLSLLITSDTVDPRVRKASEHALLAFIAASDFHAAPTTIRSDSSTL